MSKKIKAEEVRSWSEYFQGFEDATYMCDLEEVRDLEADFKTTLEALNLIADGGKDSSSMAIIAQYALEKLKTVETKT